MGCSRRVVGRSRRETEASGERTEMTDCERSPENGARDTCGAGVPGEDEGADGEDDALGSEEAERRQGECNPQWGQQENADEESSESGSGCGRSRRLLSR